MKFQANEYSTKAISLKKVSSIREIKHLPDSTTV